MERTEVIARLSRLLKKGFGPSALSALRGPCGRSSGLFPALLAHESFRRTRCGARKCARISATWIPESLDNPSSAPRLSRHRPSPERLDYIARPLDRLQRRQRRVVERETAEPRVEVGLQELGRLVEQQRANRRASLGRNPVHDR